MQDKFYITGFSGFPEFRMNVLVSASGSEISISQKQVDTR